MDSTRQRNTLMVVTLSAASILAYWTTLEGRFVFDDLFWIEGQPVAHSFENAWRGAFVARRPLMVFSLALNYHLGQTDPYGYHIFNLAIHLLTGVLLFELIRRTLAQTRQQHYDEQSAACLAYVAALIWLLHPLQTQAVCYVIQRCEAMMAMFFLLAMLLVLIGSRVARSWTWNLAAFAAFLLSLGAKEVAVMLPFVLLLYDRAFLAASWRESLRRRGVIYFAMFSVLAAGACALLLRGDLTGAAKTAGFGIKGISSWEYLRTQPQVLLHYLRLAVWPDHLCLDYQWPIESDFVGIFVPGAIVVGFIIGGVVAYRRLPSVGFLILSPLLVLVPTSSLMPIKDLAFEHRMYLPMTAIVTLVVAVFALMINRVFTFVPARRAFSLVLLVLVATALGVQTSRRGGDYRSSLRMWKSVVAAAPNNVRAHYNLGRTLDGMNRGPDAREHYERALEIYPKHLKALHNLGFGHWMEGEDERAIELLQRALEVKPDYAPVISSLAQVYLKRGNHQDALDLCQEAEEIAPRDGRVQRAKSLVLWRLGREQEAIEAGRRAVEYEPGLKLPKRELAWMLATCRDATLRDGEEALRLANEANRMSKGKPEYKLLDALGAAHAELGEFSEAAARANEAARIAAHFAEPDELRAIRSRANLYRARRPYRVERESM